MQDYHLVLQRLKSNAQNVRSKINQKSISGIFPAIPATSRHLQYTPTKTNHYTESIQSVRILSSSKWPHHHLFITLRGLQRFPTNHQPWWDSGVSEAFSMWFWQLLGCAAWGVNVTGSFRMSIFGAPGEEPQILMIRLISEILGREKMKVQQF